jgi:cell division protein FtsQ
VPPHALVRGVATVLGVALALLTWPTVSTRFRAHPYFAVQEVAVHGNRRLAPDRIRRIAGVEPGVSVWDVESQRAEARLLEEPWVRSATVRRHLPHRVVIRVREERPAAILAVESPATLYYVAAPARVVAPVGAADARDFPYVTGLSQADLSGAEAFGPQAIRQALRLMRVAARTRPVSEVHVDRQRGLTLLPVAPAVPIAIGWRRFANKLGRLPPVLALWAGREAELASISLLFDDEVIVRTRAVKPARPAKA